MSEENKPTQTTDSVNTEGGTKAEAPKDEVLSFLKESLKREFATRDEALKSLDNLNKMVGDQAINDLREKAKEADNFSAVVKAYAKESGMNLADARADLLKDIANMSTQSTQTTETKTETNSIDQSAVMQEVQALKMKLEEKELLEINPEAKAVLQELRGFAKGTGKSLADAYAGSALKDLATKALAFEKKETEQKSTSVNSTSRQGFDAKEHESLINNVKTTNTEVSKIRLVEKALGL